MQYFALLEQSGPRAPAQGATYVAPPQMETATCPPYVAPPQMETASADGEGDLFRASADGDCDDVRGTPNISAPL